ncbi:hypothetical protein SAMN04488689_11616 [Paenibacillus sp. cl6col]|uniref:hypothetical protein n=1 Tax=Paenibacillus sp. cl6col TaxID=1761878 RepID=UPI00088C150F|nr:hypothetical protein [Paenibacillus sp. cl6col]SDG46064.1 hypothetical protein SAMN04488689_11616 [Paenibacillus sp. cl6col]
MIFGMTTQFWVSIMEEGQKWYEPNKSGTSANKVFMYQFYRLLVVRCITMEEAQAINAPALDKSNLSWGVSEYKKLGESPESIIGGAFYEGMAKASRSKQ